MKNLKIFMVAFVYAGVVAMLTLVSCKDPEMYPVLNEDQGEYVQLEFINEDGSVETSKIIYVK